MAKPFQKKDEAQEPELVEMVVSHGTVHDVTDTAVPVGEKCKLPSDHARTLQLAGYVVSDKQWKALQKKREAEAELAALSEEEAAPPPAPPGEEEPPTRETIEADPEAAAVNPLPKAKKAKAKK